MTAKLQFDYGDDESAKLGASAEAKEMNPEEDGEPLKADLGKKCDDDADDGDDDENEIVYL